MVKAPAATARLGSPPARTAAPRPTRPLPRSERQESILLAAGTTFARGGYAATSMEDIAATSGITKLIVYRHFDSKEDLYNAVLDRVATRLAEEFVSGLTDGRRPGLGTRSFLTVARENPDGFRLLWRHAAREPQFATHADELREKVVWAARILLAERIADTSLHDWAAETVVGLIVESVLNWLDYGDPERDDELVAMTAASVQAMVTAWGGITLDPD